LNAFSLSEKQTRKDMRMKLLLILLGWASLAAPALAGPPAFPAPVTTRHSISIDGRTIAYRATAGAMALTDENGRRLGDMAYVAYTAEGADPAKRPITFLWGGGPGSSAGAIMVRMAGPRTLAASADSLDPQTPATLADNPDSWLAFTDLVFVDPVGTGFSRSAIDEAETRKTFWGWKQDIDWLAWFVAHHVVDQQRALSPKYLAGVSYGGFRVPQVARRLQDKYSIGIAGLIMLSPVIDFSLRLSRNGPVDWATRLPVMAAAKIERDTGRDVDIGALKGAEDYAFSDYLVDLMRPRSDSAAQSRMAAKVAALTGLDPQLVARMSGRVDPFTFNRELRRGEGLVGSRYDASITAADPWSERSTQEWVDPIEGRDPPIAGAITQHVLTELGWRPPLLYTVNDGGIAKKWDYPWGRVDATDDLRAALAIDPDMRILVAHGATDFVTPWLASRIIFDQMPPALLGSRVERKLYAGGHGFYERAASRKALRADVRRLFP
jgi:carboxypeptidase C (cathepsin A)